MRPMLTISAVVLLHLGVIAVLVGVNGCRTTTGFEKDGDLGAYTGSAGTGAASPALAPAPAPAAGLNETTKPVAAKPARPVVTAVGKGNTHTVAAGESLWVIARREGVSLDALCAANGLERNAVLHVGQKIVIPDGASPAPAKSAPAKPAAAAAPAGPSPLAAPAGGFGGFGGVPVAPAEPAKPAAPATPAAPVTPAAPKPAEPAKTSSSLAAPAGGFGGFGGGAPADTAKR